MAFTDTAPQSLVHYRGLRDWLDKVQGMGELAARQRRRTGTPRWALSPRC